MSSHKRPWYKWYPRDFNQDDRQAVRPGIRESGHNIYPLRCNEAHSRVTIKIRPNVLSRVGIAQAYSLALLPQGENIVIRLNREWSNLDLHFPCPLTDCLIVCHSLWAPVQSTDQSDNPRLLPMNPSRDDAAVSILAVDAFAGKP